MSPPHPQTTGWPAGERESRLLNQRFHQGLRWGLLAAALLLIVATIALRWNVQRDLRARQAASQASQRLLERVAQAVTATSWGSRDPDSDLGRLYAAVTSHPGASTYRDPATGGTIALGWHNSGQLASCSFPHPQAGQFSIASFRQSLLAHTQEATSFYAGLIYLLFPLLLFLWADQPGLIQRRVAITMLCAATCGLTADLTNDRYDSLRSFMNSLDYGAWGIAWVCLSALCLWSGLRRLRRCTPNCPQCKYNLTGNTSGICPECGTQVPPNIQSLLAAQWVQQSSATKA